MMTTHGGLRRGYSADRCRQPTRLLNTTRVSGQVTRRVRYRATARTRGRAAANRSPTAGPVGAGAHGR
ncbi:MAG TPA: hypothetical protein VH092_37750, partial [Urbifossiella sp.]|nr:hypothetical protein [Urbifossiella sp.]